MYDPTDREPEAEMEAREDEREYDDQMADAMEVGPETPEDYDDGLRYDEMATAEDYNRYEEEQVFQDREWDQ